MAIRRGSHCVYDTRYHVVWAPKYRKWVLQGAIRERVRELFGEIAAHHGFEMEELEVDKDHVHLFFSFSPRYSIGVVEQAWMWLFHPHQAPHVRITDSPVTPNSIAEPPPLGKHILSASEIRPAFLNQHVSAVGASGLGPSCGNKCVVRYIRRHRQGMIGGWWW